MNENEGVKSTNGEQNAKPDSESTSDAKDMTVEELVMYIQGRRTERQKYSTALDHLRKAHRMWRTGELGQITLCNEVDRILKGVGK